MSNTQTLMDVPSTFRSLYWPVAIVLALLLALLWFAGYGPGGKACAVPVAAATPAAAPTPTAAPAAAPAAAPTVRPEIAAVAALPAAPPAENVYFAVNSFQVPADFEGKLVSIASYVKANAGASVVLSGYHDPTGNKAANEELALNRAKAVRTVLMDKLGLAKERVVMAKPVETTGGGNAQEARRVEVSVRQ
jgi:outer membrane protein OmpA-like peptidoglycan-associated protein